VQVADRVGRLSHATIAPEDRHRGNAKRSGVLGLADGLVALMSWLFGPDNDSLPFPYSLRQELLDLEAERLKSWMQDLPLSAWPQGANTPIDPVDVNLGDSLSNIQGNILQGHGRSHSTFIFLEFKLERVEQVKQWIAYFAAGITSAQQQLDEAEMYRKGSPPNDIFRSFFLSAAGYRFLNVNLVNYSAEFAGGMKRAGARLSDPPVESWEAGYQKDIHAMVLLTHDEADRLMKEFEQLASEIGDIADICCVETGAVLRNDRGHAVEHFGYATGRSQPLFFKSAVEREEEVEGIDVWNPASGPNLALVRDLAGEPNAVGSYVVFRKLEQDVHGFSQGVAEMADKLGISPEHAKALIMGRFPDGTPIVQRAEPGTTAATIPNNFTFEADPEGLRCPCQAHIRRMNPRSERDAISPDEDLPSRQRRIVRRSIPYGDTPEGGVGLLFLCYQRDLATQFEFLQASMANDVNMPQEGTGIDPIMGQNPSDTAQHWPPYLGAPRTEHKPFYFGNYVTLRGGEYFFAPSLSFLKTRFLDGSV
jgi:Dyp-type peroxidase family